MTIKLQRHAAVTLMACVYGVLLLFPTTGCEEDPLRPVTPRRIGPRISKTLSDGVAVVSPVDINTAGEVLGSLSVGTASHAAISLSDVAYDLGTTDNLATTSSYPTAINSRGQVIGNESPDGATYYGFLWTPDQPNGSTGKMQRLPDAPNGPATALDVNDAGQIAGIAGGGRNRSLAQLQRCVPAAADRRRYRVLVRDE